MLIRCALLVTITLGVAACGGGGGNSGGNQPARNQLAAPSLPGLDSSFDDMFVPSQTIMNRVALDVDTPVQDIPTKGKANYAGYSHIAFDGSMFAAATGRMVMASDFETGEVAGRAGEFRRNSEARIPGEVTFRGELNRQTGFTPLRAEGHLELNGNSRTLNGTGHSIFTGSDAQGSYNQVSGTMDNGRQWEVIAAGERTN